MDGWRFGGGGWGEQEVPSRQCAELDCFAFCHQMSSKKKKKKL